MLFNPKTAPTSTQAISGRNIAHSVRSPSQRAGVAAQLVVGEAHLANPTILQASAILHVCVPYIQTALKATAAERADLAGGAVEIGDLLHPARDCELEQEKSSDAGSGA